MSGFEWFLAILSGLLMLSSVYMRILEERSMMVVRSRHPKRVFCIRSRR